MIQNLVIVSQSMAPEDLVLFVVLKGSNEGLRVCDSCSSVSIRLIEGQIIESCVETPLL